MPDTGATFTSIPFTYLMSIKSKDKLLEFKKIAIHNTKLSDMMIFKGIESDKFNGILTQEVTKENAIKSQDVYFPSIIEDFTLNNYNLGSQKIYITYDRNHTPLIGMDILKQLCFLSSVNKGNDNVFLGTKLDNISSQSFNNELAKEFGLSIIPSDLKEGANNTAAAFRSIYKK